MNHITSMVEVLGYVLRFVSVVAGLVLTLGAVWFLGEVTQGGSSWLELAAGIAGVLAGFLPMKNLRRTSDLWLWLLCGLFVVLNSSVSVWGVWNGSYGFEVLRWTLLNLAAVILLLAIAVASTVLRKSTPEAL